MDNLDTKKKYIQNLKSERDLMLIFNYETVLELKLFIIREKKMSQKCLSKLIFEEENEKIRACAVGKLSYQYVIAKIALEDKSGLVRKNATELITNQDILKKIALNDQDCLVRAAAVKKIKIQSTLETIALKDESSLVRKAASTILLNLSNLNIE